MVRNTPFPLSQGGSGCLTTFKRELDLRELLTDAEGCRDFVFPLRNHAPTPPPQKQESGSKRDLG